MSKKDPAQRSKDLIYQLRDIRKQCRIAIDALELDPKFVIKSDLVYIYEAIMSCYKIMRDHDMR